MAVKTFLREIIEYKCECGWHEVIPPDDAVVAELFEIGTLHRLPKHAGEKQCPHCFAWIEGKKVSWNGPDFPKIRKRNKRW